jgi:putative inorganic carbon (HCO3(-)) transporter
MIDGVSRLCTAAVSAVILALFAPLAALTSRKMERGLLAVLLLNLPLQIAKHFFIREDAEEMGSIGGLEISLSNLAIAGLYLGWFLRTFRAPAAQQHDRIHISLPGTLFLLFNVLSLVVAPDFALGTYEVWIVLEFLLLIVYIANTMKSRDDVIFLVRLLLIGLIFEDMLMLGQATGLIGDINFLGIRAKAAFLESSRISGTIGAPNSAASYLGMMMALAVGVMLAKVQKVDKYLATAALCMGTVPLIFTLSRGGWLGFLVSLTTIALFGSTGRHIPRKALIAATAVLALLILAFAGVIGGRLLADDKGAARSRMPLNEIAGLMIRDNPVLGVGVNNFPLAMEPYVTRGFLGEFLYTVHNKYLLVWAEAGTGAIIAFVWLLFATIRQGTQCWKLRDPLFAPIALGCTAAVAGHMTQMFVDTFRGGPQNHLLWLFSGLIAVMTRMSVARGRGLSRKYE